MKKWIALLLSILALLSLVACGAPKEDLRDASMPKKLLVSDVTSLPVASADMTIAERQKLILDYFKLQLSFQWISNMDIPEWPTTYSNSKKTIETANIYGGIPYQSLGFGNLYRWLEYYDEKTGVFDMAKAFADHGGYGEGAAVTDVDEISGYKKYRSFMTFFNQCTSSSSWSWGRVINSVRFGDTCDINVHNGFIPVGGYTYGFEHEGTQYGPEDIVVFGKNDGSADLGNPIGYDTKHVILDWNRNNGADAMYKCYAQMKPGDCLVSGGHAMMVQEVRLFETSDGTIDYGTSLVIVNEQIEGWGIKGDALGEKKLYNQGAVEVAYLFSKLQEKNYIPFTFPELQDESTEEGKAYLQYYKDMQEKTGSVKGMYKVFQFPAEDVGTGVEKAVTYCTEKSGQQITVADFKAMTVGANYSISDVFVTVKDESGKVLLENIHRAGGVYFREISMDAGRCDWQYDDAGNRLTVSEGLDAVANSDGTVTVTVTMQLSTGEKLTAFEGKLLP